MNRIDQHFQQKPSNNLAVYFTAGYPKMSDIPLIMRQLQSGGVDLIEIGIPFSDPLADGPVIQESGSKALANGFSLTGMFDILTNIRSQIHLPLLLMGYLNPVLQFGMEKFLQSAAACGIDGVILPDLPPEMYAEHYQHLFLKHHIHPVFLVTPQTSDERIRYIDSLSKGFLYAVSASGTTGKTEGFDQKHLSYFNRLKSLKLKNPVMIGFGISQKSDVQTVWKHSSGAVIGSALIRQLDPQQADLGIKRFLEKIK